VGCRAAPPQAGARGGAFSAPPALAARRRGVWKRRKSLARGPELAIDRFGPHGPCETCAESSGSRSREFGGVRVVAGRAVGVRSGGFSRLGALGIGARCVVKSFALREYFRFVVLQFMRQRRGRPVHVRCRPPRDRGLRVATAPLPCLPGAAESVGRPSGREWSGRITPLAANGEKCHTRIKQN